MTTKTMTTTTTRLDLFRFGLCYLFVVASCWSKDAVAFVPSSNARNTMMGRRAMTNLPEQVAAVVQPLRAGTSDEDGTTGVAIATTTSPAGVVVDSTDDDCYLQLLQDAIDRNSTEASSVILSRITELRQSDDPNKQATIENFLNDLLQSGPDANLPFWTKLRPLTRVSKRARLRSLRRTLDAFTPGSVDRQNDNPESQLQRRRRALVSLLRALSEATDDEESKQQRRKPAIVVLEKKAIKASKESASDLRSRLPESLETPKYDVLESSNKLANNIEIRSYKPYSVCTVSMTKPRQSSSKTDAKTGSPELGGASSFGALAGYLFGKNDQSTAMKMTTPVFTTNPGEAAAASTENEEKKDDDERMEFVLPSDYWGEGNLSKAPLPLESSGVTLKQRESETRAVLMFGGYASKKETEKRKKELLSTLSKRDSKFKPVETTLNLAQYNDPFTVPWRRLNEVSVLVVEE